MSNLDQIREEIINALIKAEKDANLPDYISHDGMLLGQLLTIIDRERQKAVKEGLKRFFKKTQDQFGGWIEMSGFAVGDRYNEVLSEMFPNTTDGK